MTKTCVLLVFSELPTNSEHLLQETSIISASAPAISFSTDTNISTPENKRSKVQNRRHKRASDSPLLSPVSTSATRRSSRLKVLNTRCVLIVRTANQIKNISYIPKVGYQNLSS